MGGPRLLSLLARVLVRRQDREFILGDLDELYVQRRAAHGSRRAWALYLRDVILSASAKSWGRATPDSARPIRPRIRPSRWDAASDLRHAIRSIRRRPTFTLMVVITLALGIGPAAAVFGMVDQLLLRPAPGVTNAASAGHLVFGEPGRHEGLSLPDFDEVRQRATLVDGMASYARVTLVGTLGRGRPIAVAGTIVYGDYFEILGVTASEGRLLAAEETGLDSDALVALISESLRDRLYGTGGQAVGRALTLNGRQVTVVGVVADGFAGVERSSPTDAWVPLSSMISLLGSTHERASSRESTSHNDILIGLRPDMRPEAVEAQVSQILDRIAATVPGSIENLPESPPTVFAGLHTTPLLRDVTHRTLRMLIWPVALLLAIACANVANLLLFRDVSRRAALATQRALGASSSRIVRQQLVESLLLGVSGSTAGLAVAWLITLPFGGERLGRMPAFEGFALDGTTALFLVGVSLLTALLFGAIPAALAGWFDLGAALKASRAHDSGRLGGLRTALSVGQISLTLALLVGGLLMLRTISNLRGVETGLDIEGVAWTSILDRSSRPPESHHAHLRALVTALDALPEVQIAALDLYAPHGAQFRDNIRVPGTPEPEPGFASTTTEFFVTPGWFEMFGVAPLNGRTFRDDDWRFPAGNEVVLTSSLARRLFGEVDAVGRTVIVGRGSRATEKRVIGVIGDYRAMTSPGVPTDAFVVPFGGAPSFQFSVMARVQPEDVDALGRVRSVLESFYPDLPVPEPLFLSERVENLRTEERLLGYLLGTLSAFGVLMSAVGLYGVIFFVVSSRRRELGIRLALGSGSIRLVGLVGRSAALIVVSGTIVGLLASYALSRVLSSQLFEVDVIDLTSYSAAIGTVALAAMAAGLSPARAALSVDPVAVLKEE